ncbi:MAG: tetratricopeptide repeat protein [Deltaproteobacteria bacterium]|nr:tetratricopeptide repeat protein [Deltaproteobacteria bacterium]
MTEQTQQNSLLGKIAAYTEILAKDPKSTIFVSLGEAYRKMGMLDDARQVIERGLEDHSDFSPAHIVLGRILFQQGDYSGSEASFQRALHWDAESLAALVGYARLNIVLGREEKARALLLDARQLSPADPVINKLLLSLPEKTPDVCVTEPEKVTVSADKAETVLPLASSTLADLYLKQGLSQQALEIYRQLLLDDPDNFLLRRKIRDIEGGQVAEDDSSAIAESDESAVDAGAADNDHKPELSVTDAASTAPPVAADEETAGAVSTVSGLTIADEQALATLNRWLAGIQQRRADV